MTKDLLDKIDVVLFMQLVQRYAMAITCSRHEMSVLKIISSLQSTCFNFPTACLLASTISAPSSSRESSSRNECHDDTSSSFRPATGRSSRS